MSVDLHVETIDNAIEAMQTSTQQMHSNLDELIQGLQPFMGNTSGNVYNAFQEFFTTAKTKDEDMTSMFAQGTGRLHDIRHLTTDADNTGAGYFSQ